MLSGGVYANYLALGVSNETKILPPKVKKRKKKQESKEEKRTWYQERMNIHGDKNRRYLFLEFCRALILPPFPSLLVGVGRHLIDSSLSAGCLLSTGSANNGK